MNFSLDLPGIDNVSHRAIMKREFNLWLINCDASVWNAESKDGSMNMEQLRNDYEYSVLMSVYCKERPEYLAQSIDSMISQTVPPREIVLVKDGKLTEQLENTIAGYVAQYGDLMRIVPIEENVGLGSALAVGIQCCSCDYVFRMDTDDISDPDRCRKQLDLLANSNLDIVSCYVDEFIDTPEQPIAVRQVPLAYDEIKAFAKRRSPFNHPGTAYRKSKVLECGNYPPWPKFQDYGLFSQMLAHGCKAGNIGQCLVHMRVGNMHKKRTNSLALKYFIKSRLHARRLGVAGWLDILLGIGIQFMLFLLPVTVSKWFYTRFLRKKPNNQEKR